MAMQNQTGSAALADLSAVRVDPSLSKQGRVAEFVRQLGDPYHFYCKGYDVTARFTDDGPAFEECLRSVMT